MTTLQQLVTVVARYATRERSVECWVPLLAAERCQEHATAFLMECETQGLADVEVVSGVRMDEVNRIIICGHFATRVGRWVVDWTARQFDPLAPVPVVTPYAMWRREWKRLGGPVAAERD